jgi:hypothetical protein
VSWEPLNLASSKFAEKPLPPAIAGLVYSGGRHVISGPPESAKTLLMLIIALEHIRAGGIVAHLDFEMGAIATRAMLDDLGASLEEIGGIYYVEPDRPPDPIQDLDDLFDAGVTLALIDAAAGAYDVSNLDDNKRADAERFARAWIRPLWERGVTTLVGDHVVKSGENRGKFAIGSERKIGQADVHLGLEVVKSLHRGSDGLIRIRTHKDRRGYLPRPTAAELDLRSDPETHAVTWMFRPASETTNGWKPTVLMEKVSRFLEQQPAPVSRNTVESQKLGARDYVRQAMDALAADGYAEEQGGQRGARLLSSLRPFRTSPDFAATSPGEDARDLATSPPPLRGEASGEDVDEDELARLHLVGEEMGLA